MQIKEREIRSLKAKCEALERSVKRCEEEIVDLKWELAREREVVVKMERRCGECAEDGSFGPVASWRSVN